MGDRVVTMAADVTRDETLRLGDFVLLRSGGSRWERSVNDPRWHGRMCVVCLASGWVAQLVWIDRGNRQQLSAQADHDDPELALANALERLDLPEQFLAAFKRPL
jgi:hypothetical protein